MYLRTGVILTTALDRVCAILAGAESQLVVVPERLDEAKKLDRWVVSTELFPQMLANVLHRSLDGRRIIGDRQPKVLLCDALSQQLLDQHFSQHRHDHLVAGVLAERWDNCLHDLEEVGQPRNLVICGHLQIIEKDIGEVSRLTRLLARIEAVVLQKAQLFHYLDHAVKSDQLVTCLCLDDAEQLGPLLRILACIDSVRRAQRLTHASKIAHYQGLVLWFSEAEVAPRFFRTQIPDLPIQIRGHRPLLVNRL